MGFRGLISGLNRHVYLGVYYSNPRSKSPLFFHMHGRVHRIHQLMVWPGGFAGEDVEHVLQRQFRCGTSFTNAVAYISDRMGRETLHTSWLQVSHWAAAPGMRRVAYIAHIPFQKSQEPSIACRASRCCVTVSKPDPGAEGAESAQWEGCRASRKTIDAWKKRGHKALKGKRARRLDILEHSTATAQPGSNRVTPRSTIATCLHGMLRVKNKTLDQHASAQTSRGMDGRLPFRLGALTSCLHSLGYSALSGCQAANFKS